MPKGKSTILYVDQALSFGGSIVVLGSLIEALEKQYFSPIVVGEMNKSILRNHIQSEVKIYIIKRLFNYLHWAKVTRFTNRIHAKVFRKSIIYILSAVRSLANTIYVARLVRIILKERVDLVHVNNGLSNLEPIIAAILTGRKYIVHCHGLEKPGFIQKIYISWVYKYIVISQYLLNSLVGNGFPRERMAVVPNPVQDTHAISVGCSEIRSEYGLTTEDRVFGIVGRIVRWKGHIEFLRAAFIVLDKIPGTKAVIIGDFSDGDAGYQEKITKMVEESGFKDRVIMTGYVEDVRNIYSILDVCVHASIEPEPFGLVIIEAMASGVPVVASDLGAPKEIIIDKVNGYLVKPESSDKLAETISTLLTNDELRKKIGAEGRRYVQENHQVEQYARSIEKIYSEVLEIIC